MTVITTSTASTATAYSNQRKVDRCQNGVLWAMRLNAIGASEFATMFYSTDDGATWTSAGNIANGSAGTGGYTPNASFFIDLDDYAHVVFKDNGNGYIYYRRGTPNAARTAWTWSTPQGVFTTEGTRDYPDVVAHREGTGWKVHFIYSALVSSFNYTEYRRLNITSGGGMSFDVPMSSEMVIGGGNFGYNTGAHTFPSIDFNHTGDGKTVAGSTPHLYAAWSAGDTGSGLGIRFKKATYSGGTWTWGAEREIDSTRYVLSSSYWLGCLFDGTRVVIGGFIRSSTNDHMLYERDAADTTTTTYTLAASAAPSEQLQRGSLTYDGKGNVYLLGVNAGETAGSNDLVYRKWDRSTTTLGSEVVVDAATGDGWGSAKRGYSNSRIEFIYTDGTTSPYDVTYDSISLNTAPTAPTALSPSAQTIDAAATNRFSWNFTDPDNPGDSQSAYDLQYRLVGAPSFTTVSGGTTTYHDFTGGTFTTGDYEWQVRTADNGGLTGPYSSLATFTAATSPSDLTITDPVNGQTISTDSYTVRWSAADQDAYQIRTVADDGAGNPDTATIYQDTGEVTSTSARSRSIAFDTTGRDEHVQVRIQVEGLWSSYESVRVTVSYTPPAAPTFVLSTNVVNGSISLTIDNPTPGGSEPTVADNDIFVRLASTNLHDDGHRPIGGDGIRIATGIANDGSYTDYAVAWGKTYQYKVRAIATNGTTIDSAWSMVTVDEDPPTIPTNLAVTDTTSSSASLSWTASTDDTTVQGDIQYLVYRDGSQVGTVIGSTSTIDSGLSPETSYSYTVAARDQSNNVSAQSSAVVATTDAATPATTDPMTIAPSDALLLDNDDALLL